MAARAGDIGESKSVVEFERGATIESCVGDAR